MFNSYLRWRNQPTKETDVNLDTTVGDVVGICTIFTVAVTMVYLNITGIL